MQSLKAQSEGPGNDVDDIDGVYVENVFRLIMQL